MHLFTIRVQKTKRPPVKAARFFLYNAKKPSVTGLFVRVNIVSILTFVYGASVHNDKLRNPYKIKIFDIRQTNITVERTPKESAFDLYAYMYPHSIVKLRARYGRPLLPLAISLQISS